MTGKGHRITTFAFVLGTTGSILAAGLSFLGSTFPDSVEYTIFGKKRNKYHRKYSHWFVPWLLISVTCFYRANWIVPRISSLIDGGYFAHYDVWSCAGFWFMGCVLHILEDAFCGTVPLFRPWKREIGLHIFHMSKKIGEMSSGEKTFIICTVIISLLAWIIRDIKLIGLYNFWRMI